MKKLIFLISLILLGINYTYAKEVVEFSDCVDGDTIKVLLDNKQYTIRMLAVDTPESVHPTKGVEYYGKEASEYTCNKIKNAKKLEIEYDPNSNEMDKYDRLLVWVFVDGELLQKDLVANGYAKVAYLYGDYKYTSELESDQELASAKSIGIWNETAKAEYNKENDIEEDIEDAEEINNTQAITQSNNYSSKDIVIIVILIIIILFVGDKTIKSKAKKKLKKYLK